MLGAISSPDRTTRNELIVQASRRVALGLPPDSASRSLLSTTARISMPRRVLRSRTLSKTTAMIEKIKVII